MTASQRAKLTVVRYDGDLEYDVPIIANAISAAILEEREACAVEAETRQRNHDEKCSGQCQCADGYHVAAGIRARDMP